MNRLKTSGSRGKAVILLTDGSNNAGRIAPEEAAAAAKALNVKIYTIGIGSKGPAPYPAKDPFGKKIYRAIPLDMDEDLLDWIALKTGAKYFRAADMTSLKDIFQEIDQMENGHRRKNLLCPYRTLSPLTDPRAGIIMYGADSQKNDSAKDSLVLRFANIITEALERRLAERWGDLDAERPAQKTVRLRVARLA